MEIGQGEFGDSVHFYSTILCPFLLKRSFEETSSEPVADVDTDVVFRQSLPFIRLRTIRNWVLEVLVDCTTWEMLLVIHNPHFNDLTAKDLMYY